MGFVLHFSQIRKVIIFFRSPLKWTILTILCKCAPSRTPQRPDLLRLCFIYKTWRWNSTVWELFKLFKRDWIENGIKCLEIIKYDLTVKKHKSVMPAFFLMHFAFRTVLSLSQSSMPSLLHFERRIFSLTLGEPTSLAIILLNFAWRRPGESVTDVYLKECGCWRYLLWVHTQRKRNRITKVSCQLRDFSNTSGLVLLLVPKTLVCKGYVSVDHQTNLPFATLNLVHSSLTGELKST